MDRSSNASLTLWFATNCWYAALQVDTQRGSRENKKLVKDIDNMKTSLPSSFDYSDRYASGNTGKPFT